MLTRLLNHSRFIRCGPLLNYASVRCKSNLQMSAINYAPPLPEMIDGPKEDTYDPTKESLEDFLNIRFGPEMPTINDEKSPQRDLVNFPRLTQLKYPDITRLFIVPDSFFRFFYQKTGVTGPYVFGTTFLTFLLSKELIIVEHEIVNGCVLAFMMFLGARMFGPQLRNYLCNSVDEELNSWDNWQKGMIAFIDGMINGENALQELNNNLGILSDAKRENVKLQLEAEFRRRQIFAYNEVKRRLDYLVAKEQAEKQYQHQHMVNWIIDGVAKSITPQQEKEAFQKCLQDLKQLSAKTQISLV